MPYRERYLFVCTNQRPPGNPKGSCGQKGGEELLGALKEALARHGVARTARACGATCLDLCEFGASVLVAPENVAYGSVTSADADEIALACKAGTLVERLVVPRRGS